MPNPMRTVPARTGRSFLLVAIAAYAARPACAQSALPAPARSACVSECHQDIIEHKVMHGVSLTRCDACHVQGNPKQHRFYLVVPKEQLCLRCHAVPHEGTTHAPVRQGRCLECHDPHGSDRPRFLKADPRRELCVACHTQDFSQTRFVHGPVAVGACIVCHTPHSSPERGLLVQDPRTLCLVCHSEIQHAARRDGHTHGALAQGCTACHDPHASQLQYQLKGESPQLCLQCHRDHFDQITHNAVAVHGAIAERGGCTDCHNPHSSRFASLQRGEEPGLCLDCHDEELTDASGRKITNMAALLAENPDHHGPIREGNCSACHEPHAAPHFRLLKEEYPADFYAPFSLDSFKLCFRCHISDLVLTESGSGLTEFRDGDRNLHFLHVNREKGRTCRSCHEVHASRHPAHIRDAVPFGSGNWMLPINFLKLPDGGSCMPGCHEQRTYSRTARAPAIPPPDDGAEPPPPAAPMPDQTEKGTTQ